MEYWEFEKYFMNPKNVMGEKIYVRNFSKEIIIDTFFELSEIIQLDCCPIFNHIVCNDWFKMSVQASHFHYCEPRKTIYSKTHFIYTSMEVWLPSKKEDLLMEYIFNTENKPTQAVYGQVPVEVIKQIIEKHWGFKKE